VFNFSEYSMHGVWLVEEILMKRMIYMGEKKGKEKKKLCSLFPLKNIVFLQQTKESRNIMQNNSNLYCQGLYPYAIIFTTTHFNLKSM